ncbi:DNA ligase 3 [Homalodisca vitripennis]|nr:DNA ligase 3 [Homalodisca vitripennis]
MVKISKDASKVPSWLNCTKTMIPDFVARDPKAQPVWEITGAEFTKHEVHTASGISVRFPRVTRIRSDKDWETATSLPELQNLYKLSKDTSDFTMASTSTTSSPVTSPRKRPATPQQSPRKKRANTSSPTTSGGDEDSTATTAARGNIKRTTVQLTDVMGNNFTRDILQVTRDTSDDAPPQKKARDLKNPLPDVFVGVKLFLPEEGVTSYFYWRGNPVNRGQLISCCMREREESGKGQRNDKVDRGNAGSRAGTVGGMTSGGEQSRAVLVFGVRFGYL